MKISSVILPLYKQEYDTIIFSSPQVSFRLKYCNISRLDLRNFPIIIFQRILPMITAKPYHLLHKYIIHQLFIYHFFILLFKIKSHPRFQSDKINIIIIVLELLYIIRRSVMYKIFIIYFAIITSGKTFSPSRITVNSETC